MFPGPPGPVPRLRGGLLQLLGLVFRPPGPAPASGSRLPSNLPVYIAGLPVPVTGLPAPVTGLPVPFSGLPAPGPGLGVPFAVLQATFVVACQFSGRPVPGVPVPGR